MLLLTRYGDEGASSRCRMFQFIPYLEKAGIECVVYPFFQQGYTNLRFSNRRALVRRTVDDYRRRFRILRDVYDVDVIFLEKEFFPYFPMVLENMFIPRRIPYVSDYDDAWFHVYDQHANRVVRAALGDKIAKVMGRAISVIAGSEYIAQYASKYSRKVDRLPTVIDLSLYPESQPPPQPDAPFTIGWIGSQSTLAHLNSIESVLDEFCSTRNARIVVIGPTSTLPRIRSLELVPWSRDTEVQNLSIIDVGIMPLPNTPSARGKCAFKLIQYMGCWKPVVASPVGENIRVVKEGENGFLAATKEEWHTALDRIYQDRELGRTMGIAGREFVEKDYSLSVAAPRLVSILRHAASRDR